jgi:hypothetical protein
MPGCGPGNDNSSEKMIRIFGDLFEKGVGLFQLRGTKTKDAASPEDAPQVHSPHAEILEGLLEYSRFPHGQGFAVLLNGLWGSGKTQFIKRNLSRFARERPGEVKQGPLYVSLYGISDVGQIEDRLFEQLHPILSHRATRLAGAVLRSAAKAAVRVDIAQGLSLSGSAGDVDLSSMVKNAEGRVIIFDDFERAVLSPVEILGYINPLVEHEDCKVIILADETQIEDAAKYKARKEKTVGRTFEFRADVASVYDAFLEEIDDTSARKFLADSAKKVRQVFADSKYDNLRLLKQFLWDFERVWKVLTSEQRECRVAMDELLELLCASAIELRRGLPIKDFNLITSETLIVRRLKRNAQDEPTSVEKFRAKYPSVRFDSTLVNVPTILDIVVRSKVSGESIREQLQRHPYFAKPQDASTPSWRALWLSRELSANDQAAVITRFEADFEARAFEEVGVIYHIFGLGIWLSELGFPGWELESLEEKLKGYVDAIYARREPNIEEVSSETRSHFDVERYGLGYRQSEAPLFAKLTEYEKTQRAEWRKRGYPKVAAYLRELASRDAEGFLRMVCFTAGGPATFAEIGALKLIPPGEFASLVAGSLYWQQSKITIALSIRYERVAACPELADEASWFREFRGLIERECEKLSRISGYELLNLIHLYLDKAIQLLDSNDHDQPRQTGGSEAQT